MATRSWLGLIPGLIGIALCLAPHSASGQSPELTQNYQRGTALYKAGLPEAAVPFMENALTLSVREFGPDATRTAFIRHNLATLYRVLGRNAAAEPEFRRALKVLETVHGPNDSIVNEIVKELSALLVAQNRHREATPYLLRVLNHAETAYGAKDGRTAAAAYNLAEAEAQAGDRAAARAHYRQALRIWQATSNSGDEKLALVRERIAALDQPPAAAETAPDAAAPVIRLTPPPARTAPAARTGSAWRVQLASLRERAAARRTADAYIRKFGDLLGATGLEIQEARVAGSPVYRVKTTAMADRSAARILCEKLKQRGQACFATNK